MTPLPVDASVSCGHLICLQAVVPKQVLLPVSGPLAVICRCPEVGSSVCVLVTHTFSTPTMCAQHNISCCKAVIVTDGSVILDLLSSNDTLQYMHARTRRTKQSAVTSVMYQVGTGRPHAFEWQVYCLVTNTLLLLCVRPYYRSMMRCKRPRLWLMLISTNAAYKASYAMYTYGIHMVVCHVYM